ncbi:hypothetical protein ACFY9Q_33765 [Streptomyces sp. NPDC012389]|uniref:hypothetical protein n=1 Tax=Streptomyces sp. NPDC012389 TaxID=3364830 RepID=UPI0036E26C55
MVSSQAHSRGRATAVESHCDVVQEGRLGALLQLAEGRIGVEPLVVIHDKEWIGHLPLRSLFHCRSPLSYHHPSQGR